MTNITKAELQARYDDLARELEDMKRKDREFRENLIRIAAEKALEHDLCTELEDCLASAGIEVPEQTIKVMRVETYTIPGFDAARMLNNDEGYWPTIERKFEDVIADYGYDYDESEVIQVVAV